MKVFRVGWDLLIGNKREFFPGFNFATVQVACNCDDQL